MEHPLITDKEKENFHRAVDEFAAETTHMLVIALNANDLSAQRVATNMTDAQALGAFKALVTGEKSEVEVRHREAYEVNGDDDA